MAAKSMTERLETFRPQQITVVNEAVTLAEELVSNHYKMSANEWLRLRYDIRTLCDLTPDEIVHGPLAQVIRYEGKRKGTQLGSQTYDFYKVCLQDHAILSTIEGDRSLTLLPFSLYIITHELIHIVRFTKFLQNFDATAEEKLAEEARVHDRTHAILGPVRIEGIDEVFAFYDRWRVPLESLREPSRPPV